MKLRLFLPFLLFLLLPTGAVASKPTAEIFLQSPALPGSAVTATDREFLQYRVEFDLPVDSLEAADFDLQSQPPGNWEIANPQSTDQRVWTVDVWRSGGEVGSGSITLRLLAESVLRGGTAGPAEPVLSPLLRIDFDSPRGLGFQFSLGESILNSGSLGSDWYRQEFWLDDRIWLDAQASASGRLALEEGSVWNLSTWSRSLEASDLVALERWNNNWWVLDARGLLRKSSDGQSWSPAAELPGDKWQELVVAEDSLWALREDGALYASADGVTWQEKLESLGGEWVGAETSPSALIVFARSGEARRFFRGAWTSGEVPGERLVWGAGYWWSARESSLYRSATGLGDWQEIDLPDEGTILDLAFGQGRIYLLRAEGVAESLLEADAHNLDWTSQYPPLGRWQRILLGDEEMVLLGASGALYSRGASAEVDAPPELLFVETPEDGSAWQETVSRSFASLRDGQCQSDWQAAGGDFQGELVEDRCWHYSRTALDAAGNQSTSSLVLAYSVPPAVTEWSRASSGTIGASDLSRGILYRLRFSEPIEGLSLEDFSFGGSAGGDWDGELSTEDGQNWTLLVSSLNATSGEMWIELQELSGRDEAGNLGPEIPVRSSPATLDLQAPDRPAWSPEPPSVLNKNFITVSFEQQEPGGTLLCSLDSSTPAGSCTSPRSWFALPDGDHTIRIWHRDAVGNTSEPLLHSFLVDTVSPSVPQLATTITNGSSTTSQSATFSWISSEPTECSWQAGDWQTCDPPQEFSELPDGDYSFRLRARDAAGNLSGTTSRDWTVDTTVPEAPVIESGPPAVSASSSATFYWSEESGSDSECKLRPVGEAGTWGACSSPRIFSFLESGNYIFEVRQIDRAGNTSDVSAWSWQIILSAPARPKILTGPAEISSSNSATFTFSASSENTTECLVGTLWEECTSPYSVTGLPDGSRTFQVRQVNAAGTPGAAALWSWTVDTTPPAIPEVDVRPPLWTQSALATFAWRSEIGTTTLCSLDGAAWSNCFSIWELQEVPEGQRNFRIRSKDEAGNLSPIWEYSWNVDRTPPPPPTWISGPEGPIDDLQSTFSWQGEAGATFDCSLDGQPWDSCTSPRTLRFAVAGEHTFRVRQRDISGNISRAASRTWMIDLVAPSAPEIIDRPRPWTRSGYASVSWIPQSGNKSECSLDGGAWQRCSSPWEASKLAAGEHRLRVRQVRPSGRSGPAAAVSWKIDQVAPVLRTISLRQRDPWTLVRLVAVDQGGSGLDRLWLRPGSSYPASVRKLRLLRQPRQARVCDRAGNCSAWTRVQKSRSERLLLPKR